MRTMFLSITAALVCLTVWIGLETPASAASRTRPAPASPAVSGYESPEEAAEALYMAVKSGDKAAMLQVLGQPAQNVLETGDAEQDALDREAFINAYDKQHAVSPLYEGREGLEEPRQLVLGENLWPFPMPLTFDQKNRRWFFDSQAGAEEVLDRRIGNNELAAMEACRAYVDAQFDYYRLNPDLSPVPHFARKILSTPGKRDGLFWDAAAAATLPAPSPLGPLFGDADGDTPGAGAYHGYRYRVLTAQGPNARTGAFDYAPGGLRDSPMFGGFALVAYPAVYGGTGVMTFIINQDGVLYEKNLGRRTESIAKGMSSFDPDRTWTRP